MMATIFNSTTALNPFVVLVVEDESIVDCRVVGALPLSLVLPLSILVIVKPQEKLHVLSIVFV